MIKVMATVQCDTPDCKSRVRIEMVRGYEDGEWNVPGAGNIFESLNGSTIRKRVPALKGWSGISTYFGQRVSWSKATCPKCVEAAEAQTRRQPRSLKDRVAHLEREAKLHDGSKL